MRAALLALLLATPLSAQTPTLPAITVSTVTTRTLSDRVLITGLIGPVEQVLVAPLVEGQPIEALLADVGDKVAAGQVLARLSRSTLELQRSQLVAGLAAAKATIAQAKAQMIDAQSSSIRPSAFGRAPKS
ncbi:MAG: biotin/lipoyl-binding protein [Cypionkella sp.]